MPSSLHETLIELFRARPVLAAELLGSVPGVAVPPFTRASVESGELNDVAPTEYRADAVVVLSGEGGPAAAIVVEVQLGRDPDKRWSWPAYLVTLRARVRCPTMLLVVCPDPDVAAWCAAPIELGHPGFVLRPAAVGPAQVPVITDPVRAGEAPELAVLSALAHGGADGGEVVLDALVGAFAALDGDHAALYYDIVLSALPEAARHHLEALVTRTYEFQSDFARRYVSIGEARGEARGEAKAVVTVLEARGMQIPETTRARISSCTDLDQLDSWLRRATVATSVEELFA